MKTRRRYFYSRSEGEQIRRDKPPDCISPQDTHAVFTLRIQEEAASIGTVDR